MAYVGLHNHDERSNFRGRDALTKTEELIEYCMELGHKGVAITNHETISSCLKANKYWTKLRKEGNTEFKIINGNEIYLCKDVNEGERPSVFPHFILLAKNRRGYEQLCELSTRAWVNNSFMSTMMRVPTYYSDLYEVIGDDKGNLVSTSSCQGGTLGRMLLLYKDTGEEKYWKSCIAWINRMNNLFGKENFFLEMQPSNDENQVYINDKITVLSSITGNNFIVSTDSHYLKAEDKRAHEIFLKAQNIEREVDSFYATTYVMSEEEIHSYMDKYLGYDIVQKAIDNTMLVYDMCEYYDLTKPLHIPYLPLNTQEPKKTSEFYEKVPLLKELSESEYDSDRHLVRELVKAMEKDKYLQTEEAYENISICLQTLIDSSNKMNVRWSAYLLQIADYVDVAWTKAGAIVGAGRGSGVGFILNYMLNIIQVNPLRETTRTFYWRFLNPERASVLDIDLDVPSSKREVVIKALKSVYGEDRVSQVLTLNTEGSRSSILTAARGLGFSDDEAQYLSSLVLSDRGMQRSLKTMYYGNDEFKPDTQFRNEMDKYPELWEAAQKIEGIINGSGSHAGGVIIVDEPFTKSTGLMRTNSGTIITQNDLHECEDISLIKIDLLATEALDKIQVCLELLLKNGLIEDKGSLKDSYEAAIGVYNIERDDPKMWKMLHEHKVQSFFQMEKESGIHALEVAKPMSVDDLATINSVMRLMAQEEGAEQPLDKYARFKNDITEWYKEMDEWGVKKEDQEILKEILGTSCGICEAQELLFLLTMHPKIGGFSLGWADRLRRSVAKKVPKDFKQLEKEYYENAKEKGLDNNLVDYVWKVLIATQRGYGFNKSHTLAYSLIGLQELNLCYKYPIIYWNTANLIVDSGGLEESDKKKGTNYGKIATAISKMETTGIKVDRPNINMANFGFTPDAKNNRIIFGLKAISGVGDNEARMIVANQPYTSFDDFTNRCPVGITTTINLIKAGCFNELEHSTPTDALKYYINKISKPLIKLSLSQITILNDLGLLTPEQKQYELRLYHFREYIFKKKFLVRQDGKSANTQWYRLEKNHAEPFFYEFFETNMAEGKDYEYSSDGEILVKRGSIDREYKRMMKNFEQNVLSNIQMIAAVNKVRFNEIWNEKASGTEAKWYMSTLSYYPEEHELSHVNMDEYSITSFKDLPEEPEVVEYRIYRGKEVPRFKLSRICGTVLDKDKNKNTITLLTPDSGVVMCKLPRGTFSFYDKRISELDQNTGKKTVLENSWFGRGSLIIATGLRRGDRFITKKYADSVYKHTLTLITDVKEDGTLSMQYERIGSEEE